MIPEQKKVTSIMESFLKNRPCKFGFSVKCNEHKLILDARASKNSRAFFFEISGR